MTLSGSNSRTDIVLGALKQYETRLVRYVTRLLSGDEEQARDVVQHAFLKLCQQDIEPIAERVGPWLYRVCRNKVFDESKRNKPQAFSDNDSEIISHEPNPADVANNAEFVELIRRLILQLPDAQREAIDLWADGLSHREIAEVMNKKEPAIRALVHRAMQNIKSHSKVASWTGSAEPVAAPANEFK